MKQVIRGLPEEDMVMCKAFPQGLVYQHCGPVADGHLLLLLQKGLPGGVEWSNLYFGVLNYTSVNNRCLVDKYDSGKFKCISLYLLCLLGCFMWVLGWFVFFFLI